MRISKYGITLIRLTEADLELVRTKRNSADVSQYMHYRGQITPEMQAAWFKTINNPNNFYYIIEYKSEKIGLVNDKNIDWDAKIAEGGLFIWDERYVNSIVPMLVSYLMIEIAFYILGWDKTFIKVLKSNARAVEYNLAIGFTITDDTNDDFVIMMLTLQQFEEKAEKLKQVISHLPSNDFITLTFDSDDKSDGTSDSVEKILTYAEPQVLAEKVNVIYL
ncbi:MAG TPA: GNAT family N-acetyltransferase [Bacteroidales bacterium]|nr:GNAT family N-acetyltransferase [Bacteroidales bacterium]